MQFYLFIYLFYLFIFFFSNITTEWFVHAKKEEKENYFFENTVLCLSTDMTRLFACEKKEKTQEAGQLEIFRVDYESVWVTI